jgi:hypothetical protein
MVDDPASAQPGSLLGPPRSVRLRLVRASNVALGTDPSLVDLYHAATRARRRGSGPGAG